MKDINLLDVSIAKKCYEDAVKDALDAFHEATGLAIKSININVLGTTHIGDMSYTVEFEIQSPF